MRSAVAIDNLPPNQIFVSFHSSFLYRGIESLAFHFLECRFAAMIPDGADQLFGRFGKDGF